MKKFVQAIKNKVSKNFRDGQADQNVSLKTYCKVAIELNNNKTKEVVFVLPRLDFYSLEERKMVLKRHLKKEHNKHWMNISWNIFKDIEDKIDDKLREADKQLYWLINCIEDFYTLYWEKASLKTENYKFQKLYSCFIHDDEEQTWLKSLLEHNTGNIIERDIFSMYRDLKMCAKDLFLIYETSPQLYCKYYEEEVRCCKTFLKELSFLERETWEGWINQ